MSYITYFFNLTENQKKKLASAYNNKKAINIKFKFKFLTGNFPIMIIKDKNVKLTMPLNIRLGQFLEYQNHKLRNNLRMDDF